MKYKLGIYINYVEFLMRLNNSLFSMPPLVWLRTPLALTNYMIARLWLGLVSLLWCSILYADLGMLAQLNESTASQAVVPEKMMGKQKAAWMDGKLPVGWPWRGIVIESFPNNEENTPASVRYLQLKGVNAIELVLSVRSTAKYEHKSLLQAWQESLQWADNMLDACRANHVVGIVSISQIPMDPGLNITQSSPEFWDVPNRLDEAVDVALQLADHFKDRGEELGAYEVLNEPLIRRQIRQESPAVWPILVERIVKAIRSKDPNRFVVVNAGFGGESSQYVKFKPLSFDRIIYGAHVYNPHEYTHQGIRSFPIGMAWPGSIDKVYWDKVRLIKQIEPLIDFKKKYDIPVWIGEFSAVRWAQGSSEWLCDAVSIFNDNGFGWMYFAFNGYHGWNPAYDSGFSTDDHKSSDLHKVYELSERWTALNKMYNNQCN
jgi:hypothetical protein